MNTRRSVSPATRSVPAPRGVLEEVARPRIADRRGLRRYVVLSSLLAVAVALAADVAQQLLFFVDWPTAIRSWLLTVLVALLIAVPILHRIGAAKLALFHAKRQLEELSRTDPLTGLPNRRALMEAAERPGNAVTALAILDIDHFKRVNDTHGHRAGDAVLRGLAPLLRAELGHCGTVGRLGGEEFAVVADNGDPAALIACLERLQRRLAAQPMPVPGALLPVTLSIGVALRRGRDVDEMYGEADRALYAAKHAGRDAIRLCDALRAALPGRDRDGAAAPPPRLVA